MEGIKTKKPDGKARMKRKRGRERKRGRLGPHSQVKK